MSRQSVSILTLTVLASASLTGERFVTATGAIATAAGAAFGVTRTGAAIGDPVPVDVLGTSLVTASANIAKGAYVQVAAGGQAVTRTTGVAVAIAVEAASTGEPCEIFLIPNAPPAA